MCPIAVSGVIFKYLLIACSIRPGQVMRWPFLTSCRRADLVGLNMALCKEFTYNPVLRNSETLFANPDECCWCSDRKLIHQSPVFKSRAPRKTWMPAGLQIVTPSILNVAE
jgi:hypothetical protein